MATPDSNRKASGLRAGAEMLRACAQAMPHILHYLRHTQPKPNYKHLKAYSVQLCLETLRLPPKIAEKVARKCTSSAFGMTTSRNRNQRKSEERFSAKMKDRSRKLFSKALATSMPESERRLKEAVQRRFSAYRFVSNKPVMGFYPDLYSESLRLIIEVDGSSHAGREEYDAQRDAAFQRRGISTLRIPARLVMSDLNAAMKAVEDRIQQVLGEYRQNAEQREKELRERFPELAKPSYSLRRPKPPV